MVWCKLLGAVGAACVLAGCAASGVYTGVEAGGRRSFSQLDFGRSRPAAAQISPSSPQVAEASGPAAAAAPPGLSAPPVRMQAQPALAPRVDVAEAGLKVRSLLVGDGFSPETARSGAGERITATRMTTVPIPTSEAECALHALNQPQMYAVTVDVSLSPPVAGGPLRVQVRSRFTVMDANLVSGDLTKHACRSRGVLEAAVRRAALDG